MQINLKKTPITVQVKTGIKPSLTVAVKQKESNNELLKYYELGKKDYQHGKTNTN